MLGSAVVDNECTNCWGIVTEQLHVCVCVPPKVMETEQLLYLVTEYASGGEIFGKVTPILIIYFAHRLQ